jgi:hypothetical protein
MADPLSISASIIAILQLTGTVVQYISDVKSAPQDRQRILDELVSVTGVLYHLKGLAERPQSDGPGALTVKSLDGPKGPLDQFKIALERLAAKLAPSHGVQKFGKKITWPFQKAEIKEILDLIERQKSLFNMALNNDHM